MYDQFFFLAVAAIFFVLYIAEAYRKEEGFLLKDFWMVVGLVLVFAAFFFNYSLTQTTCVTPQIGINGTTIQTCTYSYAVTPDLSPYAYAIGLILVVFIFVFLYSGLMTLWNMRK